MEERRLKLVVSNPPVPDNPKPLRSVVQHLHPVPDSDLEIRSIVKKFSSFLLRDDTGPLARLKARRRFDTSIVVGAIDCLSPKAATLLQADLVIIATLSLHPTIRRAAVMKLAEAELS